MNSIQTYTSARTSINSTRLPAVYNKAQFVSPVVLDYGCGKYIDRIRSALSRKGIELLPYDLYNQPEEVNKATFARIDDRMCRHAMTDIVCSNVLNVIDTDMTIYSIAYQIESIIHRTGGRAFVTVYEGDRSGIGRQTGPDQYQRNEPLRNYLRFFWNARIENGMIVVGQ